MPNTDSLSWPNLSYLFIILAAEDCGEMVGAESLAGAIGGGQDLRATSVTSIVSGGARQLSQLPQLCGRIFAEMAEQGGAAAAGGFAKGGERVQPLALQRLAGRLDFRSMRCRASAKSPVDHNSQASAGSPSRPARPVS